MKNKIDKKVNKIVKQINKQLYQDVFKERFWLRQVEKTRLNDTNYYLYEMCDRLEPNRNTIINKWLWGESVFLTGVFYDELNDFIVRSDFWSLYFHDDDHYCKELDKYWKE